MPYAFQLTYVAPSWSFIVSVFDPYNAIDEIVYVSEDKPKHQHEHRYVFCPPMWRDWKNSQDHGNDFKHWKRYVEHGLRVDGILGIVCASYIQSSCFSYQRNSAIIAISLRFFVSCWAILDSRWINFTSIKGFFVFNCLLSKLWECCSNA